MNSNRLLFNFRIGIQALLTNRVRAILTSLGIIFGVSSVIAMLAIGRGAEKEILEQMKQVGSNNIVIKVKAPGAKEDEESDDNTQSKTRKKENEEIRNVSPGLTKADVDDIALLPSVNYVSPELELSVDFLYNGLDKSGLLVGVNNNFFKTAGAEIAEGKTFTATQMDNAESVCIIGKNIKAKLFAGKNTIGQYIKCGKNWLMIVGVLDNKNINEKDVEKLSIRNINDDVFVPLNTMLLRYKNRALLSEKKMQMARRGWSDGSSYHQLDKIVINVKESAYMLPTVEVLSKMMKRRHSNIDDYEIVVPELLLKQEQKTKSLFNIVLAIIASISLVVGGIGIMNIMLASVLERTKEIGLRLALGATKRDVHLQFLSEAVSISVTGGIIGIILGVTISMIIQKATDIQTIVSVFSIFISFTISVLVGLIFGIFPARRAAKNDPVVSLRGE